jgi:hypothetical protein
VQFGAAPSSEWSFRIVLNPAGLMAALAVRYTQINDDRTGLARSNERWMALKKSVARSPHIANLWRLIDQKQRITCD